MSTTAPAHAAEAPVAAAPAPAASTLGDPFALGLASFGISALVLATVMSGLIDPVSLPVVLALAIALGFFTELIAGILHFMRGETFAGLVFTTYAGFWLSYALLVQFFAGDVVAAEGDPATVIGMYLLAWGIFSTYMLLAALKTNTTTIVIFVLLCAVFYLAAIGNFTGNTGIGELAGLVLIADAAVALYASAALIVNDTWGRAVLPIP